MRLVFAGTPAVAVPALVELLDSHHEVIAVVTRPDAPSGRKRVMTPSPIRLAAEAEGIEVLTPTRPSDPKFLARLTELAPDCCPVVAYGALLPPQTIAIPRHGWLNLHFSLLPAWRGAAPVQRAVWHGDDMTGATVFQIGEGLDDGPVYGHLTEKIDVHDTAGTLLERLSKAGAKLLLECLNGIEAGRLVPVPQPVEGISLAPKVMVEEAGVRWNSPSFAVDRQIRACTPNPGAWAVFRGARVKLGPVLQVESARQLAPGEIQAETNRLLVGTKTEPIALGHVQPSGKKLMSASDWARGVRLESGEKFDA